MNPSHTKILVIDDEPIVLRKTARMLELEGFIVHAACGGNEGIAAARREHPDLILCDITMPEIDGHAVLEALRRDTSTASAASTASIPFIFLTARGQPEDLRSGADHGGHRGPDDYLVKPVDLQTMLHAIRARLNRMTQLTGPAAKTFALSFKSPKPLLALGITEREAEVLF